MAVVERSALLRFRAQDLYALVADVEAYPQFLPGCTAARVEHREEDRLRARLSFRVKGLSDSFATENQMTLGEGGAPSIRMRLVDGPFRQLSGAWEFQPLGEGACKVSLRLSLEFGNRVLEASLGPWVDRAVNGLIDAFRLRAEALYGGR
ncbi:MAG TPA: type II toxin-antitoxin system RatA family toxin [Solimonas sp.]|nr:type II toxin-antitoxin system RatA family toxin [Solimonas sp.]